MEKLTSYECGYEQKVYGMKTKRYVQAMNLSDDPELIKEYRRIHSEQYSWPEIRQGIRAVGILEMELYICGTTVVMIVDTPVDFNWKEAMARLATLPRQQEWEDTVAEAQKSPQGATSAQKWHLMERFFYLYENQ